MENDAKKDKTPWATWELFRAEIERNLAPDFEAAQALFSFLLSWPTIQKETVEELIEARLVAAYEAAIVEYLHPRLLFRVSHLLGETIALGTVVEKLSLLLVEYHLHRGDLRREDVKAFAKRWPESPLTFNQAIDILHAGTEIDSSLVAAMHSLRKALNHLIEHMKAHP